MGGLSHGSWCKHIPQRTAIVVSQDDARLRSTALISKAWNDKIEAASGHQARSSLPSRFRAAENSQTAFPINCGDSHNPVPGPSKPWNDHSICSFLNSVATFVDVDTWSAITPHQAQNSSPRAAAHFFTATRPSPCLLTLVVQCAQLVEVKHCCVLISFSPAMKVGDLATSVS
jgi:hypothetical protein